jgi:RimJ/RimL family protein N-acetyltransferase
VNVITTGRLLVREVPADQVAALLAHDAGAEDWADGYPHPGSRSAARAFQHIPEDERRSGFGIYHIVRRDDGLVIGDIGFHAPPKDGVVEIGFGLVASARGAGYATGSLVELTRWALDQPGVERVVARTLKENVASQAVLARAGFRRIGEEANLQHWSRPSLAACCRDSAGVRSAQPTEWRHRTWRT